MASDHRGRPLHAGKRTMDQYPRITRALAKMNRRDFERSDFGGGYPPSKRTAMSLGEMAIEEYKGGGDLSEHYGSMINKAVSERKLPDIKALGDEPW